MQVLIHVKNNLHSAEKSQHFLTTMSSNATLFLSLLLLCGLCSGAEPADVSPVQSLLDTIQKTAQQGEAKAQYDLGVMYRDGRGVEQSYEQAAYWLQQSADQGETLAQSNLETLPATQ